MKKIILYISFIGLGLLNYFSFETHAQSSTPVDTMIMHKSAEFNYETSSGVITLENFVTGEMSVSQEAKAVDVILVLDYSSSMTGQNGKYSTDSTYTRVVTDKYYNAQNIEWQVKSQWINYNSTISGVGESSANAPNRVGVLIRDSNKNQIKLFYNGSNRDAYLIRINNSGTFRHWIYVLDDDSKRVFVRLDGSFVKESGSITVGYNSQYWPVGEDGFKIYPAHMNDRPIFWTRKYETNHTYTRSEALQFAAGKFIDNLKAHADKSGKTDRVAVVAFQGPSGDKAFPSIFGTDAQYLSRSSDYYLMEFPTDKKNSNNLDGSLECRTLVAKRFTDISSTDAVDYLKFAISGLTCKGQTPVNNGIDVAKELFTYYGRQDDDVARYVIVFTDGDPTSTSTSASFSSDVANKAVLSAYGLKNSTTVKTKVYTIYCHSSDPSTNANKFMDHLSSNYPYAQEYNDNTTKLSGKDAKYYKTAKDNLAVVFDEITQEIIVETSSKYDVNTTLNDFINNEYFQLPDSATVDDIYVYENKCASFNNTTKEYRWASMTGDSTRRMVSPEITVSIVRGDRTKPKTDPGYNDKISITGYDYGKNWCGMDISKTPNVAHGARVIVKIPFVYTTSKVWGDLPTNSKDSGVTVVDSTGTTVDDKKYNIPTLPFCYIKLTRAGLHKGESAIYMVEKPDTSGGVVTYEFVDKVVINGTGSGLDTIALYGVPGLSFRVTETDWNWAYDKSYNPQTKTVDKSVEPYELRYDFTGDHKNPTGSTEHEKEKDPANLHNHDEAYKRNHMSLPTSSSD